VLAKEKKPKKPKKKADFNLRSWMIGQLRRMSRRYPPIYQVRNEAKETYTIPSKTGKPMKRVRFTCSICKKQFPNSEIRIDHIDPIIPVTGFPLNEDGTDDWSTVINRMFCSKDKLQALCITHHDEKSKLENSIRKENRTKS
jgi:hypothetical protein